MEVFFLYQGQRFVWDSEKASRKISKHGVGFETACQVFFDPFVRVEDASVAEEKREASHVTRERDDSHYFSAVRDAMERRSYEDSE
jgi:hypothetical protein